MRGVGKEPVCYLPDEHGELAVTCWCECHIVFVAKSEVLEGQTKSCGSRGCRAPESTDP